MDAAERQAVVTEITANAGFTAPYAIINALSAVIACYGMFEDSAAVVIGAMLVATLLGPIMAIALSLVNGDLPLLGRAFATEFVGGLLVIVVALIAGSIHRDIPLNNQVLSRTNPNILDLVIALAGGAAGAYSAIVPSLSPGIAGVAIATALVPPLATCGICLARGELSLAGGGFLLFFTNLVGIQSAAAAVMALFGFRRTAPHVEDHRTDVTRSAVSLGILVVLAAILGLNFAESLHEELFEEGVRSQLLRQLQEYPGANLAELRFRLQFRLDAKSAFIAALREYPGARLADLSFRKRLGKTVVIAVIRAPFYFDKDKVAALEDQLRTRWKIDLVLRVRSVLVREITRHGEVYEPAEPANVEAKDGP